LTACRHIRKNWDFEKRIHIRSAHFGNGVAPIFNVDRGIQTIMLNTV
jgi:hypothetical protein